MRISTSMFQQGAMQGLRAALAALAKAQQQATSGHRVSTVSDDPTDAAQVMRMQGHLRDIEQFRRNMAEASTRISTEDVVLKSARDLMNQAQALATGAATASPTDPLRLAAIQEVRQIRQQLVALGNTRLGDEYVFGGSKSGVPPFQADGTYVGDSSQRQAQIDDGVLMPTNHTGDQILSAGFRALDDLERELGTGTATSIEATAAGFIAANHEMLAAQTELGSRLQQIQYTTEGLTRRGDNLADRRDALRDVDPTEAALKVVSLQSALERAYAAVGKILNTNFLNYF